MSLLRGLHGKAASLPYLFLSKGYGPSGNVSVGSYDADCSAGGPRMKERRSWFNPERLEKKMMRKIARSIIPVWLISAGILIFSVHENFAYAKQTRTSVACGNAIKQQCSGVPVQANNVFECFQKNQDKLSKRCAALALNVIRTCDRDASRLCQGVVAGLQGNIVGCLTTAKNMVSSRCNAALDAAGLR